MKITRAVMRQGRGPFTVEPLESAESPGNCLPCHTDDTSASDDIVTPVVVF
jgi:hypothetical protein